MLCEFGNCVFNDNNECLNKSTTIDCLGMCKNCTPVYIPREQLSALKREQLKYLDLTDTISDK